jgi:phage-related tail protein
MLKSEKVKKTLAKMQAQAEATTTRMPDIEANIENVVDHMNNILEVQQSLNALRGQKHQLKMEYEMTTKNIASLTENLDLFTESDEELQRLFDLHHKDVHRHDADESKMDDEKKRLQRRYSGLI